MMMISLPLRVYEYEHPMHTTAAGPQQLTQAPAQNALLQRKGRGGRRSRRHVDAGFSRPPPTIIHSCRPWLRVGVKFTQDKGAAITSIYKIYIDRYR